MLSGHNWVMNGSYLQRQVSYKSNIGMSDYTALESGRKWTLSGSKWVCPNILRIVSQKLRNLHLNCTQIARKAMQHESLCPLRSPWLNSAPAHERAPPQPAPAVHPRTSRAEG